MGANATTFVPTYVASEILTAADLNVTNSGIPVFADSAARTAAFGGTGEKVLAEGQYAYLESDNSTSFWDGASWQPVSVTPTFAIFNEQQASGTGGGTFTSGSYAKRVLNTTVVNTITGCSISSSVITLPAGTFLVQASAPAAIVNRHKARLQNTTAGTTISLGDSSFSQATAAQATTNSLINCVFTLSVSSTIELQHQCETTRASNGYGIETGFGDSELYSQIQIQRIS